MQWNLSSRLERLIMSSKLAVVLIFTFAVYLFAPTTGYKVPKDPPKKKTNTLRLLFSISRHGDRIQDTSTSYPKDPYKSLTYFPYGFAQLTNAGIRRNFKLGKILRKNYDHFLGPLYYGGIVQARSTNFDRTIASLLATLAGLFPPHPINVWSNEDELAKFWLPVPLTTTPLANDTLLLGYNCPKAQKYYEEYKQTPEYQNTFNKYKDLFDYVQQYAGVTIPDMNQVRFFFYRFTFQEGFGLTLPDWTKAIYPDQLTDALVDAYYANSATPELRKYTTGFFFKEIIEEIKKKMAGTLDKGRKIYVYSGHEVNIAYTMITLGIMYKHYPKFCENLTFEVHEIKGEYYVRVLHQEFLTDKQKAVSIPGCTEYCPFEQFVEYLSDTLPGPEDTCYDRTC